MNRMLNTLLTAAALGLLAGLFVAQPVQAGPGALAARLLRSSPEIITEMRISRRLTHAVAEVLRLENMTHAQTYERLVEVLAAGDRAENALSAAQQLEWGYRTTMIDWGLAILRRRNPMQQFNQALPDEVIERVLGLLVRSQGEALRSRMLQINLFPAATFFPAAEVQVEISDGILGLFNSIKRALLNAEPIIPAPESISPAHRSLVRQLIPQSFENVSVVENAAVNNNVATTAYGRFWNERTPNVFTGELLGSVERGNANHRLLSANWTIDFNQHTMALDLEQSLHSDFTLPELRGLIEVARLHGGRMTRTLSHDPVQFTTTPFGMTRTGGLVQVRELPLNDASFATVRTLMNLLSTL